MLADILTNTGHPDEAIGLLQQAMRMNPRYQSYYPLQLGTAYGLMGRYNEAFTALQEALQLNPTDPNACYNLAASYFWQWLEQQSSDPQILERAAKTAKQYVTFSNSSDWTLEGLSAVYLWQKRYDEALAEAERAVTLNPTELQNQANLGRVLNSVGRSAEVLERIEQGNCTTAIFSPCFCFSVVGNAYYLTRRHNEAVSAYQQGLQHPPLWNRGLETHLGLAASYSELGRTKEARAAIAEVLKSIHSFL